MRAVLGLILLTLLQGPLSAEEGGTEIANSLSVETFEEVWETIHESYFDPEFGGLDWEETRTKYLPRAEKAADADALRPVLNEMLLELGQSHFGVIPGSAELEEAALVAAAEEEEEPSEEEASAEEIEDVPSEEESGDEPGDYSGLHLRLLGNEVIISRVDEDSPAAGAGLRAGQTVKRIGDLEVAAFQKRASAAASRSFSKDFFVLQVLGELTGAPDEGETQSIVVRSPGNGAVERRHHYRPIRYPGKMSTSVANMPSVPLRFESRRLPLPQGDVLYLHFNIFLPELMGKLRSSIKQAVEDDLLGLIVDLRGNPGGIGMMANGLAGLLTKKQFSLGQMKMRAGEVNFVAFPQRGAFLGPVVILVDAMSASTSEIFAAGLQEAGRAHVVGRRSMGAALPSFIRDLPNGDRLQHAIADLTTAGGRRVEGRGVIPNDPVPLKPKKRYQGSDPDLEKAMKWLQRQAKRKASSHD